MAKAKRPSMQGKGADLFFSGELPQDVPDERPTSPSSTAPATRRPQASKQASKQDTEGLMSDAELLVLDSVLAHLDEPGHITNSFRFSRAELDALDDLIHEVRRQFNLRLAKQDVARLGVSFLVADFAERREGSFLAVYLRRQQRRTSR